MTGAEAEEPRALTGTSWGEALALTRVVLGKAGVESAALDARLLVADALGTDAVGLLRNSDNRVAEDAAAILLSHTRRRLAREPVGRILGRREFWGLDFRLAPDTLEPRPDTEIVVEAALEGLADRTGRILDLGTGTGCILIALLHELPGAWGLGIDRQVGAARTARLNAEANGVGGRSAFVCGDWAEAIIGRFDLVVSNPPYIRPDIIAGLAPEVARFDPRLALDGGPDGLDAYRAILVQLPSLLTLEGRAVLEIGFDQAEDVAALALEAGFGAVDIRRDLAGHDRAVTLTPRRGVA